MAIVLPQVSYYYNRLISSFSCLVCLLSELFPLGLKSIHSQKFLYCQFPFLTNYWLYISVQILNNLIAGKFRELKFEALKTLVKGDAHASGHKHVTNS